MSDFQIYFTLGLQHISDPRGYDHILFLVALCAIYRVTEWRQVLVLVTAFTVGHSVTLALSVLGYSPLSSQVVEMLIPFTILLTAVYHAFFVQLKGRRRSMRNEYLIAAGFGLIHGLGFANFLSALLGEGESLLIPLLAFNLGLEAGQIIIVTLIVLLSYVMINLAKIDSDYWRLFISGLAAGPAIILILEKLL